MKLKRLLISITCILFAATFLLVATPDTGYSLVPAYQRQKDPEYIRARNRARERMKNLNSKPEEWTKPPPAGNMAGVTFWQDANGTRMMKVPIVLQIQIWEYACYLHLKNNDLRKAGNNLKTMNYSCESGKRAMNGEAKHYAMVKERLRKSQELQARTKKQGKPFVCSVPEIPPSYLKCLYR